MPITMLYAGALAFVLLALSVRVIQARGATKVFIGDGGNELMIRRMRGQANFVEYVPLILVLLALLEYRGTAAWLLHAFGASLVVARVLHAYAFAFSAHFPPGRFLGTAVTQLVLVGTGALCLWQGFATL